MKRLPAAAKNPKRVANLVQGELMGRLKAKGLEIEQSPISMKGVALSADLVESGAISGKMLKDLYDLAFERGEDFPAIYEKEKPQQITDTAAFEKIIDEVIAANPKQAGAVSRRQDDGHRILRRTGDEGHEGTGKPGVGKRASGEKTGGLELIYFGSCSGTETCSCTMIQCVHPASREQQSSAAPSFDSVPAR